MKQRNQNFALGLTVIAFVTAVVGTILFLQPLFRASGRDVTFQFRVDEGMAPLKPGSAVLLGGSVQIGRVNEVRVEEVDVEEPQGTVRRSVFLVEAEIRNDIPLYGDANVTTGAPTIGGSGFVLINNVGTPGVELEYPIPGQPPQTFQAAIARLSALLVDEGGLVHNLNEMLDPDLEGSVLFKILVSLSDINVITDELRTQMDPRQRQTLLSKLHRIIDDINNTTTALRSELDAENNEAAIAVIHDALNSLDEGLREAVAMLKENRPLVHDSVANIESTTRTLDENIAAALRAEFDRENPTSLLSKIHVAMDRVNTSLANLNTMTGTGERLLVVSRPTLERTLANFKDMSEQLRLASQEVLLNPSKLIWAPKEDRQEQLLVFQAARSFAEAASQLDNAAGRLEAVLATIPQDGQIDEPVSEEIRSIFQSVKGSFQRFERAEQALWDQLQ
jgi:ABC-type transporter Mla subunit MlaD